MSSGLLHVSQTVKSTIPHILSIKLHCPVDPRIGRKEGHNTDGDVFGKANTVHFPPIEVACEWEYYQQKLVDTSRSHRNPTWALNKLV